MNRVDSGGRDGIDDVDNTLSDAQDDIVATVVGGMAGKAAAAASPVAAGVAGCLGGEAGDRLSKWASGKKAKTNVRTLARKCVEGIVGTVVAP